MLENGFVLSILARLACIVTMGTMVMGCVSRNHVINSYERNNGTAVRNQSREISGVIERTEGGQTSGSLQTTCSNDLVEVIETHTLYDANDYTWSGVLTLLGLTGVVSGISVLSSMEEDADDTTEIVSFLGGTFLIIGGGMSLIGGIAYFIFPEHNGTEDEGVVTSDRHLRHQTIDCNTSEFTPLNGQLARLLSGTGRRIADLSIDQQLRFDFSTEDVTQEDIEQSGVLEITFPRLGESGQVQVLASAGLEAAWEHRQTNRLPAGLTSSAVFVDGNGADGRLEPEEQATIDVVVANHGPGSAFDVVVAVDPETLPSWLTVAESTIVGNLEPNQSRTVAVPVSTGRAAEAGEVEVVLQVLELGGFDAMPLHFQLPTIAFRGSSVTVASFTASEWSEDNGDVEPNEEILLQLVLVNNGEAATDSLVRLDNVDFGRVQGEDQLRRHLEVGDSATFEFRYILPSGQAEGVSAVTATFAIVDERMGAQQPYNGTFPMGAVTARLLTGPATGDEIPSQRIFLMERSDEVEAIIGASISSFHEALTGDGRITIATTADTQVALSECMDDAVISPNERRNCEIAWANGQLYDWALLIDMDWDGSSIVLILQVFDPHTNQHVRTLSEDLEDSANVRDGLRALGRTFQGWLRQQLL